MAVPDLGQTQDDEPPVPLFTVWGCPLLTRVHASHPYLTCFDFKVPPMQMDLGQITTARLAGTLYSVERVR